MNDQIITHLPKSFRHEKDKLLASGFRTWESIKNLNEIQINNLIKNSLCTGRNLKRLRGMAKLICELKLSTSDAALLIHSGISSVAALASTTPETLSKNTGRLERQLKTSRSPQIDLCKANFLIHLARNRQMEN